MSLSRKLIDKLIVEEIEKLDESVFDGDKDVLKRLVNQLFLDQVSSVSDHSVKRSVVDKIDQFYSVLVDDEVGK
jgi:hypothetical protein